MATRHFLDLGHKRIAYVSHPSGHYSVAERQCGYDRAMREAGLQPRVLSMDWFHQQPREHTEIVNSWLTMPDRPTAFIFYAHETAALVFHLAELMGLGVPKDFSLMCISDEIQKCLTIELDTSIIPFAEIGALAVEKLMQKIENPYSSFPVQRVPFTTIKRGQSSRSLLG
jgi:LacI family transcriptional regulator